MEPIIVQPIGQASSGQIAEYRFNTDGTVDVRTCPASLAYVLPTGHLPATLPESKEGGKSRVIDPEAWTEWRRKSLKHVGHTYLMAEKQARAQGWETPANA